MASVKLKKKHIRLITSLLILVIGGIGVLLAPPAVQEASQIATQQNPGLYTVESAADGDTITVAVDGKKEKVRLIGVDTPEKNDPRKPLQCYAKAASAFTASKVKGQKVRLETDSESDTRDRYGRLLRFVYLQDGTLLNKQIVSEGYGFAMTGFAHTKMNEFKTAQAEAEAAHKGLWGECTIDMARGYPQTNSAN